LVMLLRLLLQLTTLLAKQAPETTITSYLCTVARIHAYR
jgi:hypothetical protein